MKSGRITCGSWNTWLQTSISRFSIRLSRTSRQEASLMHKTDKFNMTMGPFALERDSTKASITTTIVNFSVILRLSVANLKRRSKARNPNAQTKNTPEKIRGF